MHGHLCIDESVLSLALCSNAPVGAWIVSDPEVWTPFWSNLYLLMVPSGPVLSFATGTIGLGLLFQVRGEREERKYGWFDRSNVSNALLGAQASIEC